MNLRRLCHWIALPDAARSPWNRRLVWAGLVVLVLAGVVAWRASRPVLGKDVKLVNVSREEAEVIAGTVREMQRQQRDGCLNRGEVIKWLVLTLSAEELDQVAVVPDGDAMVSANFSPVVPGAGKERHVYVLKRSPDGWGLSQRRREKVE